MSNNLQEPNLSEMIRTILEKVNETHQAVYGNGKKGLLDRMSIAETKLYVIFSVPAIAVSVWAIIHWVKP